VRVVRFLFVISVTLVYCAGTLAFMFLKVAAPGGTLVEPNRAVALSELALSALFAVVGLAGFVVALWNMLKSRWNDKG
jgi:hypothetical protein